MPVHFDDLQFAAIDFESTGFTGGATDEPIQIGIAIMRAGTYVPADSLRSFITPSTPRPISDAAYSVHRIGEDSLRGAPTMIELWPSIRNRLADRVVVAHGSGTEKRFLRAFPMHGFSPWLDTLSFARRILPNSPNHSLGTLCEQFELVTELRQLCPDLDWHDALFDAAASLLLLRALVHAAKIDSAPLEALELVGP